MNFVDFVIDCYSHITSHVSQVFASHTHYTSYSLLNIVHVIVCVYGLTNQVIAKTLNYVQTKFVAWKFVGNTRNFVFGNIGLKILDFKIISSHTHAFLLLWVKSSCFSKIVFFLKNVESLCLIRSVHFVFRPIEIFKIFKIWERESLSVSTDRG